MSSEKRKPNGGNFKESSEKKQRRDDYREFKEDDEIISSSHIQRRQSTKRNRKEVCAPDPVNFSQARPGQERALDEQMLQTWSQKHERAYKSVLSSRKPLAEVQETNEKYKNVLANFDNWISHFERNTDYVARKLQQCQAKIAQLLEPDEDDVESQTLDQQLLEAEAEDLDFQSKIQAYDLLTAEEEQLEAEIAENDKDYEDKINEIQMKIDEFEEMANTEEANLTLLLEKIDQEQNAKLQGNENTESQIKDLSDQMNKEMDKVDLEYDAKLLEHKTDTLKKLEAIEAEDILVQKEHQITADDLKMPEDEKAEILLQRKNVSVELEQTNRVVTLKKQELQQLTLNNAAIAKQMESSNDKVTERNKKLKRMEEAKEKLELEQNIEKKKISDEEKRIESLNLKRSELQKQLDLVKQSMDYIKRKAQMAKETEVSLQQQMFNQRAKLNQLKQVKEKATEDKAAEKIEQQRECTQLQGLSKVLKEKLKELKEQECNAVREEKLELNRQVASKLNLKKLKEAKGKQSLESLLNICKEQSLNPQRVNEGIRQLENSKENERAAKRNEQAKDKIVEKIEEIDRKKVSQDNDIEELETELHALQELNDSLNLKNDSDNQMEFPSTQMRGIPPDEGKFSQTGFYARREKYMNPDNLGEEFDTGNELTQVKSKLQEFSDDQDIIGDNREQLQSKFPSTEDLGFESTQRVSSQNSNNDNFEKLEQETLSNETQESSSKAAAKIRPITEASRNNSAMKLKPLTQTSLTPKARISASDQKVHKTNDLNKTDQVKSTTPLPSQSLQKSSKPRPVVKSIEILKPEKTPEKSKSIMKLSQVPNMGKRVSQSRMDLTKYYDDTSNSSSDEEGKSYSLNKSPKPAKSPIRPKVAKSPKTPNKQESPNKKRALYSHNDDEMDLTFSQQQAESEKMSYSQEADTQDEREIRLSKASQSSKKETPKKKPGPKARAKKDSNSKPYKSPKKNKKSKNKEDERLEEMFNFFGKKKDK